jgi:hypothetical protein
MLTALAPTAVLLLGSSDGPSVRTGASRRPAAGGRLGALKSGEGRGM